MPAARHARPSPTPGTRFSVQGPLHATVAGVDLNLGPKRQQAVFAVLLFNREQVVTPQAIMRGVWGDEEPASGTRLVPPYIYRLRRIFAMATGKQEPPAIDSLPTGYRLRPGPGDLDIDEFEMLVHRADAAELRGDLTGASALLATADGMWRGEPLGGLPGPFADGRRRALVERRILVQERRLDLEVRLGRLMDAIPALLALRTEHPFREQIARLLMVALYRAGRQSEALTVFAQLRAHLADRLGIDPTPDLIDTHQAILQARPVPG